MAPSSTLTAALLVLTQFSHLTTSASTEQLPGRMKNEVRQVHIDGPTIVVQGVTVDPAGVFAPDATVLSGGGGTVLAPGVTVDPNGVFAPSATALSGGTVLAPGVTVDPAGVYAPSATVLSGGTVLAPSVTVDPSGVYAPSATVTPGGVNAPGVTVGPGGVIVSGSTMATVVPGGGSLTTTFTNEGTTYTTVVPNTSKAQEQSTRAKQSTTATSSTPSATQTFQDTNSAAPRGKSFLGAQLGITVVALAFVGLGSLLVLI